MARLYIFPDERKHKERTRTRAMSVGETRPTLGRVSEPTLQPQPRQPVREVEGGALASGLHPVQGRAALTLQ